ncbi:MAG TPA: hypothetical protein VMM12_14600 [Longimicrobiales bacterium]|nr:hypothetical protein [Longimicrobiales bacterium]
MQKTIAFEGRPWTVWISPAPAERGAPSGLDLVFTNAEGQRLRHPVGPALLRALSRDGLDVDEAPLLAALAAALKANGNGHEMNECGGGDACP